MCLTVFHFPFTGTLKPYNLSLTCAISLEIQFAKRACFDLSCKRAREHIVIQRRLRDCFRLYEGRKKIIDHATSMWSALHTYRRLFLPHLDVLPLRLSEVIPDLLVACRSKDSFNLTDCWWHGRMLHTKKHNKSSVVYLLLETLSSVVSSTIFSTLYPRTRVKRLAIFVRLLKWESRISWLQPLLKIGACFDMYVQLTNGLTESHIDCAKCLRAHLI